MVTYLGTSTATTFVEPCWCCGKGCAVSPCSDETGPVELMYYCSDCEDWNFAERVEFMPGGGITTRTSEAFDPATSYRSCAKHEKAQGNLRDVIR